MTLDTRYKIPVGEDLEPNIQTKLNYRNNHYIKS